jgi:hypothetical protein
MSGVKKLFEAATPRFINSHGEFIYASMGAFSSVFSISFFM